MTTPWDSILPASSGPVWRLRSATARHRLYHGRDADRSILFLFEFSGDHVDILRRLPEIAGIDLDYRRYANPRRHGLVLRLTDSSSAELFAVLNEDLANAIEPLEEERQAVLTFMNRLGRWQKLLASGSRRLLKPEEIRRLMGELVILEGLLMERGLNPERVVSAWTGPSGTPQDFQFTNRSIEVKATGGAGNRTIRISSEFQLDTEQVAVTLAVCHLPVIDDPSRGQSLNQLVGRISGKLPAHVRPLFEGRLELAHYVDIPEYDAPLFEHVATDCFEVGDGFPALSRSCLPSSISEVRYQLDVAQLSDFRVAGIPELNP